MALRKVIFGQADQVTGIIAHDTAAFVETDRVRNPIGGPLIAPSWIYGSGQDGDVTISSSTTLTANKDYENLTISDNQILNTGGFVIRVRGTLTLHAGAQIRNQANSATSATGATGGAVQFYGVGAAGANGSQGSNGNNAVSITGHGGNGGAGGAALTWTGGTAGFVTAPFNSNGGAKAHQHILNLLTGCTPGFQEIGGGAGGGGGAGDGSGTAGRGGGGGAGGRVVVVFAHSIVVLSGTATISANGGDGAAGSIADGGGGGGGGGGVCVVISFDPQPTGLQIQALAGAGGAGIGAGLPGANGSPGFTAYYRAR